jgi:hypothetical protein
MARSKDPLRIGIQVVVYVALYFLTAMIAGSLFLWAGGYLVGITVASLAAAVFANWLSLLIHENAHLPDLGLWWNRRSADNLALGLAGGMGAASLVLLAPVAAGAARFVRTPAQPGAWDSAVFVLLLLAASAAGEELFFRGYGFQVLLAAVGPYATILPVAVVFALLHTNNPNATWLGIGNTAGFGILFGYAYVRSRDLWLPIGLHYGWNLTLPLFGVNLSGITLKVTGYELAWSAGKLWSGGAYGPEASVLTSAVLLALFAYLYKAPIRRQASPLTDPPAERALCEPAPPSLS